MSAAILRKNPNKPRRFDPLLKKIGAPLVALYVKLLARTLRLHFEGLEHYQAAIASNRPMVMVFWHEDLINIAMCSLRVGSNSVAVMVSRSRDGEMLSQVLRWIDMVPVRGSSSRGAVAGFTELLRYLLQGGKTHPAAALGLDGPRGPRRVAKPGAAMLARKAGALVFATRFEMSRAKRFKSWDRMALPWPFSVLHVHLGEVIDAAKWGEDDAENTRILTARLAPRGDQIQ